ncbi:MAG: hypothetical protein LBG92_12015 [Prevotellaceae bacterium]|jgi:hypothetical protein|nr:hypothetical protein [Prevotellaceae bacterium]
MIKQSIIILLAMSVATVCRAQISGGSAETLESLAEQFVSPPDNYKPHAWWHWLGSNFSKEGMTKDLRAMKEAGVGGVVVFNAPSWLDPKQNPWQEQTYRSVAYWEAFGHALSEARKLNMKVGLHNSPGWSTTGGPWISPEQGMQAAALSTVRTNGGKKLNIRLPLPELTSEAAQCYRDVAVMAVPVRGGDILDISQYMDKNGTLDWQSPTGEWTIYRVGHYPTMVRSHPAPEDVADYALEVDKMNPEATVRHWNNVLNPLKDRFSEYIGTTFDCIWIDSYEAGEQNWSPNFRADFIRIKGYDPVRQLVKAYARGDSILDVHSHGVRCPENASAETKRFVDDYTDVVNRLFMDCWHIGREAVNRAGFRLCWEPYCSWGGGPFDMRQGVAIADVPVTEFWVHSREPFGGAAIAEAAAAGNRRIVGAEAFTGMEATCKFNESPAMLKRPADMGFSYGINLYFLHSWAHNPFDDRYQPGFGFAHYGTHFSRNQTWYEPGKAFFTYLARCQMLLQQGTYVSRSDDMLHRRTPEADIFFVRNTEAAQTKTLAFPAVSDCAPELWDAYTGTVRTADCRRENDRTILSLPMEKDGSLFVIFPTRKTAYAKSPEVTVKETSVAVEGAWTVYFQPKTDETPFRRTFSELVDFTAVNGDTAVKYFSGTAVYEKTFRIQQTELGAGRRIAIDLGKLHDIAEVEVNGVRVAVLWHPPYQTDITPHVKSGDNTLRIHITNNWANRLIGDEQYPEDFEWTDRNNGLRAMKGLPAWFVAGQPRPVKERRTFMPWYYFKKDSPLYPAGLTGHVSIVKRQYEVKTSQ